MYDVGDSVVTGYGQQHRLQGERGTLHRWYYTVAGKVLIDEETGKQIPTQAIKRDEKLDIVGFADLYGRLIDTKKGSTRTITIGGEEYPIPPSEESSAVGVKYDSDKPRPWLLFKSLNRAVQGVLAVLEYGAKKYAPDNWKNVQPLEERYLDALGRHYMALMSGETHDAESGLPHIDHILCCALFVSEWQKTNG